MSRKTLEQKIKDANPVQGPYLMEVARIVREQSARDSYPAHGLETAPLWPGGLQPKESYVTSYPKASTPVTMQVGAHIGPDGQVHLGNAPAFGSALGLDQQSQKDHLFDM